MMTLSMGIVGSMILDNTEETMNVDEKVFD